MRTPRALPVYPWGDNEKLYFGDDKDVAMYWDGTYFKIAPATGNTLTIKWSGDDTYIYGGFLTTQDLYLYANVTDLYPFIYIYGNDAIRMAVPAGKRLELYEGTTEFIRFDHSGSWIKSDKTAGNAIKLDWVPKTTTGNVVGLEIDASTNLTMGVNFGVTGLKIAVKAANGAGESYGVDLSGVPNTEITAKLLNTADAVTAIVGTHAPASWIKIQVGATAYYIPYWTVDGA